jgi:hypothetical protein
MKLVAIILAVIKIPFKIWKVLSDGFKKGYSGASNGDQFK